MGLHTATLMQNPDLFDYFKTHWDQCAANTFLNTFFINDKTLLPNEMSKIKSIQDFYLGGKNEINVEDWTLQNLTHAMGDAKYVYGTDKMAHQLAKYTTTYYYHFDHVGSYSLGDILSSSKPELLWNLVKKVFGIH